MGHGGQIEAAYNIKSKSYNYDPVFQNKPITIEQILLLQILK